VILHCLDHLKLFLYFDIYYSLVFIYIVYYYSGNGPIGPKLSKGFSSELGLVGGVIMGG
jgi:hypothetical protein